jgi:hypothetical protein
MSISGIRQSLCVSLVLAAFAFSVPACGDDSKKGEEMVQCKDGSASKPGQGACSHHGGVQNPTAKCKDGTFSYSEKHEGACASHGGVDKWLDGK